MAYLDFLKGTDLTCRMITKELEFGFGVGRRRTDFMRYDEHSRYPTSYDWIDFKNTNITLLYDQSQLNFDHLLMASINKIEHDMRLTDGEYFDKEDNQIIT